VAACLPNRQATVNQKFCLSGYGSQSLPRENCRMGNQNRIREWRKSKGRTLEQLADESGLSVSYLSRMESGERNVSLRNLEQIAGALKVAPSDLVGGPSASQTPTKGSPQELAPRNELKPLDPLDAFGMARIDGTVQAGAFLQVEVFDEHGDAEYISAPRDPDFPHAGQIAYRVEGDSMNQADRPIRAGDFVIAVMLRDIDFELDDLDGEIVVVQQTLADGQLRERSLKVLRVFQDRFEFHPQSDNPAHKPIIVTRNADPDDTRVVEAIALHRFTFDGKPRPLRKPRK
jgi:transcriptional regulator with XRE-family HTH domain